jgi:oligopeptide/dipeptide ABC transporter ATP-binding protein
MTAVDAVAVATPTLVMDDVSVAIRSRGRTRPAIDHVSLHVNPGEVVCLVGESGCGKTLTALAAMRLLPPAATLTGGRVLLGGEELTALGESEMRGRRGRSVSMIFQEPMTALDPSFTVGYQLTETYLAHRPGDKAGARARAEEVLGLVGIPDGRRRLGDYPHQFSGGMRQRIVIAIALMMEPKLLIADEPTTALDVTIQAQILDLILDLREKLGMSVLFITHDLGVVDEIADRVVVMYAGEVVETAPAAELFTVPCHPYSQGLLRSMPALAPVGQRLPVIEGRVPNLGSIPSACRFAPRCPNRQPSCDETHPTLERTADEHELRCFYPTPFER